MDTNIPHDVEQRLQRIEQHVGLPAPGEEEDVDEETTVEDPEDE